MEACIRRVRSWLLPLAGVVALAAAALPQATGAARVAASLDWPQFLHDPQHSSVSPATAFTTANAGSVTQVWHWAPPVISGQPPPRLEASPTMAGGRVYIGSASPCSPRAPFSWPRKRPASTTSRPDGPAPACLAGWQT